MDESHTSVKENGESKVIVLMAVPWGAEIRLFILLSAAAWCSEGGCREVTFVYSLSFTSALSSYPPPSLAVSALIPSGKRRERKSYKRFFSGGGRQRLLNKLETWKDLW